MSRDIHIDLLGAGCEAAAFGSIHIAKRTENLFFLNWQQPDIRAPMADAVFEFCSDIGFDLSPQLYPC